MPELPHHRPGNMTVTQVLDGARGALRTAEEALRWLEGGAPAVIQLALIRYVVIECRRSTFVLQKLSSRVDGFDTWYEPRRSALAADPLMRYFHDLRNQIEKEGLPGTMAEIVDRESGGTIADVACGEDRHGIWVAGAVRTGVAYNAGTSMDAADRLDLANFRLPDPPSTHRGATLNDRRFATLARLAIDFLREEVIDPADLEFGDGQEPRPD